MYASIYIYNMYSLKSHIYIYNIYIIYIYIYIYIYIEYNTISDTNGPLKKP